MTLGVTVLLGAGIVLIASALDNTPLITTFQKIMSGQKIDWTGKGTTSATTGAKTPPPKTTAL